MVSESVDSSRTVSDGRFDHLPWPVQSVRCASRVMEGGAVVPDLPTSPESNPFDTLAVDQPKAVRWKIHEYASFRSCEL